MKFRGSLFLVLFLILFIPAAFCIEEKTTIRVGISDNKFASYDHTGATFILPVNSSIIDLEDDNQRIDVKGGGYAEVKLINGSFNINVNSSLIVKNSKGPVIITSPDKIGIKGLYRKGEPAYYKGMIELRAISLYRFNIINILDMQSYLKGVVPNEMPVSFGIEALKAQTVAARNYANRPVDNHKNYDTCDSTSCQVYYGANSEQDLSNRAVDETLGIYALYEFEPILAQYSSTASGITESYINTYGNGKTDKPYLQSVKDNDEVKYTKNEDEIKEFFKENIPSFDMKSPRHRWKVEFDRFELEDVLDKTLKEQSKAGNVEPYFKNDNEFYGLEDIKVIERGDSYKALIVEIKSASGDYKIKKELPIRRAFKKNNTALYSANFSVEKEYKKLSRKELKEIKKKRKLEEEKLKEEAIFSGKEPKEEDITVKLMPELKNSEIVNGRKRVYKTKLGRNLPDKFIFYGAGFGHGVGMSQYGAGFLASYGVNYENILKHYYTGINLGTLPKIVSYNNIGLDYVQEFYFDKKQNREDKFENPNRSPLKKELKRILKQNDELKCYLVIENPSKVSKIEFFINGYYFSPDTKGFNKKNLKTDITDYLADGNNKVIFKPLHEKDKNKTLKFYIEIGE